MNKEHVKRNLIFLSTMHEKASKEWEKLFKAYDAIETFGHMKLHVDRLVNLVKDINLTPSIQSEDEQELNEVKRLNRLIKKTLKENNKQIKTALQDGVICNNGILHCYMNYNQTKLLIKRRNPFEVALFENLHGEIFALDKREKKLWTKEKVFLLNDSLDIIGDINNPYNFIPYLVFAPHRIEHGGTKGAKPERSIFGLGGIELEKLQYRLEDIEDMRAEEIEKAIDIPLAYTGNVNEEAIEQATSAGGRVKLMNTDDKIFPIVPNAGQALQVLDIAEAKNNALLQSYTAQTPATMGFAQQASLSGRTIKEHKSAMMISLKDFEEEYISLEESLTKLILLFAQIHEKGFFKIKVDSLEIKKWSDDLDTTQALTLTQNIANIIATATDGISLDLSISLLDREIRSIASRTDDPEAFISKIQKIINLKKEQLSKPPQGGT